MTALPDAALEAWRFDVAVAGETLVLPDGCRDLIVHLPAQGAPAAFVSALADAPERVPLFAGDRLLGVRLHAGAAFDEHALVAACLARERFDLGDLFAAVGAAARIDPRVDEALAALARAGGVAGARAALGVSERTLERLLARTGRSPAWWRGLARARRCARALVHEADAPLAALACDHGYADQAHMARELRRWFGATPSRLRAEPGTLVASGFG